MPSHTEHGALHNEPSGTATMSEAPSTPDKSAVIAVYNTHVEAEEAVRALQKSGYDLTQLSIVGKDYQTEEAVVGFYTAGDRIKAWGGKGAFWGSLWGILFGSAFFIIPGIGPLLAAGPLVAWIIGALEGAVVVGGLSALGAGLYSIGIPKDSILEYEEQIKMAKFVVIAHGATADVDKAEGTLAAGNNAGIKKHSCCA